MSKAPETHKDDLIEEAERDFPEIAKLPPHKVEKEDLIGEQSKNENSYSHGTLETERK